MWNKFSFMAGFECTYAKAEDNIRFDLLKSSKHDEMCREDYELLKKENIFVVREGLSWSQIDQGNKNYDFSRFEPMMQAGKDLGIEQIWDLNHFDFPDHLDPFTDEFATQFAEYALRCLEKIRQYQKGEIYLVPINEPSFFAWMCDNGLWAPYKKDHGTKFKKQLIKAAISAMRAIKKIDKQAYFLHTDPYMYRLPMHKKNEAEQKFCQDFNENVKYQSWDMIVGKVSPELGGSPEYLDAVGVNYYFYNQQQVGIDENNKYTFKSISLNSKLRLPLSDVLSEVYRRYQKPIVIAETGSYRIRRPKWWAYVLSQIEQCLNTGLPLLGVCAYPTLDIVKGAGFILPQSGLWDFDQKNLTYERLPHQETLAIIEEFIGKWQDKMIALQPEKA